MFLTLTSVSFIISELQGNFQCSNAGYISGDF